MSEAKTYSGSCHCGAVKFTAELALEGVMQCNCSLCSRAGYLLAFVPAAKFSLASGKEQLTDYQFNKKVLHHPFCSVCGVRAFGYGAAPDGTDTFAVNVRCLEGVDVTTLTVNHFDGKSA